jgi:alkanesulfonate monooxygenase SsuD/methylene tetrahydromethanopterin reductase-like flavin-dependent oxidoreductase (luciferase family)
VLGIRFDMRAHPTMGASQADLHQAMLDQCAWADELGFDYVWLSEHHGAEDGYMPSPLVVAAALAARTADITLLIAAILLPLHDPIRIAEDIAIVDTISRGRLQVVLAGGYAAHEFAMFGKDPKRRPSAMLAGVEAIKQSLTGEPFVFDGRAVRVTPRPFSQPRPALHLGGNSEPAARRAAGLADGYFGSHVEHYLDECARRGVDPENRGWSLTSYCPWLIHVSEDPERDWERMRPFAQFESQSYVDWGDSGEPFIAEQFPTDEASLRERYLVLTAEQTIEWARSHRDLHIRLHPLMGGMDPEFGWSGMRRFVEQVLPTLRAEQLV